MLEVADPVMIQTQLFDSTGTKEAILPAIHSVCITNNYRRKEQYTGTQRSHIIFQKTTGVCNRYCVGELQL